MTKFKLNLLFPLLCLILSLLFPASCTQGVKNGLSLSVQSALPALFPSLVFASLLTRQKSLFPEKRFLLPFFLSLICGFPVGASAAATLVSEGELSRKDGEKLLFFCNNASPAFLISYCGGMIFKDVKKGLILYLLQCAVSFFCLLFFFGKPLFRKENPLEKSSADSPKAHLNIPLALREGMNSFLYIMSCIIFFSFLSELCLALFSLKGTSRAMLGVFLELCGGLEQLKKSASPLLFPLGASACGWGGLSVHLQTAGILQDRQIGVKCHLAGRAFFAVVLFVLTLFLEKLL